MNVLFLDASFAIALASTADHHHERALDLARDIEDSGSRLATTRAVILEIGNALARVRYRQAAIDLLDSIELDSSIEIIPVSESLCGLAFELYRGRPDKEWGLTDCLSFMVMRERGLTDALTADLHFVQAGFRALLLDE